jgi:hypothetical protein
MKLPFRLRKAKLFGTISFFDKNKRTLFKNSTAAATAKKKLPLPLRAATVKRNKLPRHDRRSGSATTDISGPFKRINQTDE